METPATGWVKLDVDGAYVIPTGEVAWGGLLRDELGRFIIQTTSGDCLTAEIWGCLLGLKTAWDSGFRWIQLEPDFIETWELLRHKPNLEHYDHDLIKEVLHLLGRDWEV